MTVLSLYPYRVVVEAHEDAAARYLPEADQVLLAARVAYHRPLRVIGVSGKAGKRVPKLFLPKHWQGLSQRELVKLCRQVYEIMN